MDETLYDRLRRECLHIGDLHDYLEWRGMTIDRSQLTKCLKETVKFTPKMLGEVERWIEKPINPEYYKTN